MLNKIWTWMLIISFVVSFFTGRVNETAEAIFESSKNAVTMCIGLLGIMCFWSGIMEICKRSKLINGISKLISPLTKILFPGLKSTAALGPIILNMVANIMGLANAATPLGIKAMGELQKINKQKDIASNYMCTFVVVNTASIQLIPSTVLALRSAADSQEPFEIIICVWICSVLALTVGVIFTKILERIY